MARMANSCAKPKCQDLLNTYSWENYLTEPTERKAGEQIICLDLDSGVSTYCCEEQPNNKSNNTVTAYLGKEWGSIAASLQGEACKEIGETDEVFITYDTDIMDCPSSLLEPHGIWMHYCVNKSAANDMKSFNVST